MSNLDDYLENYFVNYFDNNPVLNELLIEFYFYRICSG